MTKPDFGPRLNLENRPKHFEDIEDIAIAPRFIDNPDLSREEKLARIDSILEWSLAKLHHMEPIVKDLVKTKVQFYGKPGTDLDPQLSTDELFGDDVVENATVIKKALDHRQNATLGYNQLDRSYNSQPTDTEEQRYAKESVRSAALSAAMRLGGFLPDIPKMSNDAIGRWLDMQDNEYDAPPGKVDAAIIAGAAGLSIHSRLWLAVQDIESGALETDTIIMAAYVSRKLRADEKKKVLDAGLTFGYSAEDMTKMEEFFMQFETWPDERYDDPEGKSILDGIYNESDLSTGAATDLLGAKFDTSGWAPGPAQHDNSDGIHKNRIMYRKAEVTVNDKPVTIYVVNSDHKYGWNAAGKRKDRPDTLETFQSTAPFLPPDAERVAIYSHGAWIEGQGVRAKEAYDLDMGVQSIAVGPHNASRLFLATDNEGKPLIGPDGNPIIDILRPEEVIDEIAKTYQDTANLYKHAKDMKDELLARAAA